MYQYNSRVRYSEVDANCKLTWNALLNYFQDGSVFHSESIGRGVSYWNEHQVAWVLSSWQICLNEMPGLGDEIVISTWPYEMKAFYGYRNFALDTVDGRRLAYANSVWVLMDMKNGRPIRVSEEITNAYGLEPALDMNCSSRKIVIPDNMKPQHSIVVPKDFIDTNQHMNNEKYVMLAMEFVPENFTVSQLRVEYRREAKLQDVIFLSTAVTDTCITVLLSGEDEKPYAVVEFLAE